jgi:uncharacterized damage-inducible protein DinB
MDLLDRLLGHDAWTTRRLLLRCRELTDEQLDREFDIGHRTVRATLAHIVRNVEAWTDLMDSPTTPTDARPQGRTPAELLARQESAAEDLARLARRIAAGNAWDERWIDRLDDPPTEKTYGGAIAHVLTHSMHHRAQVLYMMKKLGIQGLPEGDVLGWEEQAGRA